MRASQVKGVLEGAEQGLHFTLCFACPQFKGMLERVEQDVLRPLGVSFLRIDGSIDSSQRFAIVQVCALTLPCRHA